jgi:hypothetical protein
VRVRDRGHRRQLDHHVLRADHPEVLAGQPLEHAGVVPQALDADAQPLARSSGGGDLRPQRPLVGARRLEIAGALEGGDGQQGEDEQRGHAQDGAERIAPDGRFGPDHGVQRGKALAPG